MVLECLSSVLVPRSNAVGFIPLSPECYDCEPTYGIIQIQREEHIP